MKSEKAKQLARKVAEKYGVLLTPEALRKLRDDDIPEMLERSDEVDLPVFTAKLIRGEVDPDFLEGMEGDVYEILGAEESEEEHEARLRVERPSKLPPAAEVDAEVEILEEARSVSADGSVNGFVAHFRDRLEKLRPLVKAKLDGEWVKNIEELVERARREPGNYCVAGVVTDLRETERAFLLDLEDEVGKVRVVVSKSKAPKISEKVRRDVAPGMVIGVKGFAKVERGPVVFVGDRYGEVTLPGEGDSKSRVPAVEDDVKAVFIGDVHIGSKKFREDLFRRFLEWLNNPNDSVAGHVKYVIVTGDVVDGIGIYPGQREELEIADIDEQYQRFAEYLELLPDWIEVIVIPGNHDAIRQALPQPSLSSSDPAQPLTELDGVHLPSNPALVRIHGELDVLLFHGQSLDDIIIDHPDAEHNPDGVRKAVKLCLRARHLVPIYGGSVPIAPLPEDRLVIRKFPHVLAVGHTHVSAVEVWNGCNVISTATFQEQTEFQKKVGISPTVGRVIVLNMRRDEYENPKRRFTIVDLTD
ncbi:DNA-directed DNA polymerase II small subunit [Methanopyrus sp.]